MTHEQVAQGQEILNEIDVWKKHKEAIQKIVKEESASVYIHANRYNSITLFTETILSLKISALIDIYLSGVDKQIEKLEEQLKAV